MSGLLLDTPLSAEQHDYVSTVRLSATQLLDLVNDILDFSKVRFRPPPSRSSPV
jgi:signal transduction histidine kinase